MALARKSSHWIVPIAGHDQVEYDNRPWLFFMYRDKSNGIIYVWIIITCEGQDGWLRVNHNNNTLELHTQMDTDNKMNHNQKDQDQQYMYLLNGILYDHHTTESIDYLITTMVSDYYFLIKSNNKKSTSTSTTLTSSSLSSPSSTPEPTSSSSFINVCHDYLGLCTWSSLGINYDLNQINQVLSSLEKEGIPIRYLLLDDGWQSEKNGYLLDFDTNKETFVNGGLKKTIQHLKSSHPSLLNVGVWHTLWGYWNGVDSSAYSHSYQGIKTYKTEKGTTPVNLVNNISKFYDDYYRFLKKSGVGMVKIDNQGAFHDLKGITLQDKHKKWSDYLDAVHHALKKHAIHLSIHCMAVSPHLLDQQIKKNKCYNTILRNSDDYFPDEMESHTWHIYTNILNSLWTSQIYNTLDFDMFQSNHPFALYHATSRAISGGPIYITDKPGNHDATLLKKLVAKNKHGDDQLLRCKQPCFPLFDTIFNGNPAMSHHPKIIAAWNKHGRYRIIGYWNMSSNKHAISTVMIPKYYIGYITLGLEKGSWLWNSSNNIDDHDHLPLIIENHGCSLVTLSPVYSLKEHHQHMIGGITCLGLLDKLNGNEAIISTECILPQRKKKKEKKGIMQENEKETETEKEKDSLLFKVKLSHQSEQCGFFFSSTNTTIQKATLDGYPININPLNESPFSSSSNLVNIWIIDMSNQHLRKSSSSLTPSYFEIILNIQLI
ncbi:unnamed protein product [Cunninghamella echinulata]